MALSQIQWFDKLKSWVPQWYFESSQYQEAHWMALAKLLSAQQSAVENSIAQTFITTAEGPYLDLLGSERSKERLTGELDSVYRQRVRNLTNSSNRVTLQALIDSLLVNGPASISEDYEGGSYLGRGLYLNRGQLLIELIENAFSIVLPNQVHAPYSFFGREHFDGREDFTGTISSPDGLFESIIKAVDDAKAFGVVYRLIERAG